MMSSSAEDMENWSPECGDANSGVGERTDRSRQRPATYKTPTRIVDVIIPERSMCLLNYFSSLLTKSGSCKHTLIIAISFSCFVGSNIQQR